MASMVLRLGKWLGFLAIGLVVVVLLALVVLRFGDGPTGIVAGGAFSSGTPYDGPEPDWSFLADRQEVEFQLVEPPRSRTTWILEHAGRIYIPCGYMDSTWGRLWKRWPIEAERDGRALLRVDGRIYARELRRVQDSSALPDLASELVRKYLRDPAAPPASEAERDAVVEAVLERIRTGSLWIFELAPPAAA